MAYPNTNELATLAEVKALINVSVNTYDTFINANLATISRAIETYCRRRFLKNTWTQWVSVDKELFTDNWPINNVLLVGAITDVALIADTNNIYNFSIMQPTSNNINIDAKFVATNTSTLVSTEFLFSTYQSLVSLKVAVEASLSGVTFNYQPTQSPIVYSTLNTLTLRPTNGKTIYAGINYFDLSNSSSVGDVYRIADSSDRLFFNPNFITTSGRSGNFIGPYSTGYTNIDSGYSFETYQDTDTLIVYDAGYTTANVPQELKFVVASIIRDLMSLYDIDSSGVYKGIYKSETLADYTYVLDTPSKISELINKYHDMLVYFMKKVI